LGWEPLEAYGVKNETKIGAVLTVILGIYGWTLSKRIYTLDLQRRVVEDSNRADSGLFVSDSGIDISGKMIHSILPSGSDHTLVFILRGSSIHADLAFWDKVQADLTKRAHVHLVGYCDGDICTNSIRAQYKSLEFPVVSYGEIGSSQVLFSADRQGNCLLLGKEWGDIKRIKWRGPEQTPTGILKKGLLDNAAVDR
jgi:hypothetical protein